MNDAVITAFAKRLRTARHVTVLTGAGISAESGIPTFRDAQTGLWSHFDPEELASPAGFARNPALVWRWYAERRVKACAAQPNPAHYALAELAQRVPQLTLITQNIDGLHQRAGSPDVIELHGSLHRARCMADGSVHTTWDYDEELPLCPDCGALLRPDVVWFGEMLPRVALETAWAAALDCDVFMSIGTSGVVEPAASLPRVALGRDATVLILNLEQTTAARPPLFTINGKAGEVLPQLVAAAFGA
ncbi:NAD-dependent deacylase [Chloroflexus sp.]|uniref:SIR2 family NAD-dependent protein deacylase n=1 Tax=Chloroflexus sp. TaxID=1904827 RepID=UPI00298EF4D0|nr:NAD-dependent deacylase [Chloroflexus sp.]MCS6886638.1 NAD-dependent deacylase [Chloroflexus sp.]MDW8403458.1 NAD-dependent deacylase [Chloroflexus sp.]